MTELVDRTVGWDSAARYRILAATSVSGWTCPGCGSALALTGVLKSPRNARFRVRLECSLQSCQGIDLVARVSDRKLFAMLAGVRMRNVRMPEASPPRPQHDGNSWSGLHKRGDR